MKKHIILLALIVGLFFNIVSNNAVIVGLGVTICWTF